MNNDSSWKPSLKRNKYVLALVSVLGLAILIPLFQNCNNKNFETMQTEAASSDPLNSGKFSASSSPDCPGGVVYWEVGTQACSANTDMIKNGGSVQANDTTLQLVGSATFKCNQGVKSLDSSKAKHCQNQANIDVVVVNGECGSSNNQTLATAPVQALCAKGVPSIVSGQGPWTWNCLGLNTINKVSCSALKSSSGSGSGAGSGSQPRGRCGSGNNSSFMASAPPAGQVLCYSGTASIPSGSGPWTWICSGYGVNDNCSAGVTTEKSCSSASIEEGIQRCNRASTSSSETCQACAPSKCKLGYEAQWAPGGSPTISACVPLSPGSCQIPAGRINLASHSTVPAWQCDVNQSGRELTVGQSVSFSCVNNGFTATINVRCQMESVAANGVSNGGQNYSAKRLFYDRGIYADDWSYAVFSAARDPILQERLGEKYVAFNYPCSRNPDIIHSDFGGIRVQGPMAAISSGFEQTRCLLNDSGEWQLIKLKCVRPDQYNPTVGNWSFVSGEGAQISTDRNTCTGIRSGATSQVNAWVTP